MKIAYDLDGVLVNDFAHLPNISTEQEYYENIQAYIKPLFEPKGKWYLLTARNEDVAIYTTMWVNENFTNPPVEIIHDIGREETPATYKAKRLKEHKITHYVESDPDIVYALNKVYPECKTILFSEWIKKTLFDTAFSRKD